MYTQQRIECGLSVVATLKSIIMWALFVVVVSVLILFFHLRLECFEVSMFN